MLNLKNANSKDLFEIVCVSFKDGVSIDDQESYMEQLNGIIKNFEGFKSRDYFYSHENKRWVDFVSWTDLSLAKKASDELMKHPLALELISMMDEKTMIFSHYENKGGTQN